ncbi:hypothetical protein EXIGLDRAFT_733130 [Exidia glandulosa HHB12029]|uniref:Uncharacterized protein n=1 Tax=Exidia glandulosa HHB12029 TaxID=1314781 RepID=A0A165KK13_EXIGL|nr:hypothetical protein EXIGLDRAFT_733130 [Exidia glandulosa HHB12029]
MGVGVQGMPALAASAVLQKWLAEGLQHFARQASLDRSTKEVEPSVRREEPEARLSADPTPIAFTRSIQIVDLSRCPSVHSSSTISISVRRGPFS